MNYKFFAWLNVALLVVQLIPYVLGFLNRHVPATKIPAVRGLNKAFRKFHKQTGALLLVTSLIHGYLALGGVFRLHTGTILFGAILLAAIVGFGFYRKKEKQLIKVHRTMALVIVALFLVHYFTPNLMFYVLRALNLQ